MSSSYRLSRLGLSHWDPYAMHRGGCLELTCCGQEARSVNDIRWQIWHSDLLLGGGSVLRRSRLDSSSWMRHISNFSTVDLLQTHCQWYSANVPRCWCSSVLFARCGPACSSLVYWQLRYMLYRFADYYCWTVHWKWSICFHRLRSWTPEAPTRPRKPCNCNKSQCLKLYVVPCIFHCSWHTLLFEGMVVINSAFAIFTASLMK